MGLLLMFLDDRDVKDQNQKLKIVKDYITGERKVIFSPSDMGATLGAGFANNYKSRIIKKVKYDTEGNLKKIKFNFKGLYILKIMDSTSFADAKWMARRIGMLSREQIYGAFA
jgi:hypothetical protein